MNREEIIKLAREAGLRRFGPLNIDCELERFANLVAAAQRIECAKMAEETNGTAGANYLIANVIRARSQS